MKKNYIVVLLAFCAGIPLVVGLRMRYNEYATELATSVDVQGAMKVAQDATGEQTIDTAKSAA